MVNIDINDVDFFSCLSGHELGKNIAEKFILPRIKEDDMNVVTVPENIKQLSDSFLCGLEEILCKYNDILCINANEDINKKVNERLKWRIYKPLDLPSIYRGYKGALEYIQDMISDYESNSLNDKDILDDIKDVVDDVLEKGVLFDGLKRC